MKKAKPIPQEAARELLRVMKWLCRRSERYQRESVLANARTPECEREYQAALKAISLAEGK